MNRRRIKIQRRQRSLPEGEYRQRCYGCYRPVESCFCKAIPEVENQTAILILQHRRERTHPFNTARIVNQALRRCQLIHDRNERLAELELPIRPNCGLLYPGRGSRLLTELDPAERPEQLVVLDGTWHHAKTMFRDIPRLQELPQFQLAPSTPGQFRIRLEPTETALSTLEATVQALQQLEPDTEGLDNLLKAFHVMVDQQLAHPQAKYGDDQIKPKVHNLNVPHALTGDLSNVVVVYGESMPAVGRLTQEGISPRKLPPVYWVAQRMASTENLQEHLFHRFVKPAYPIPKMHLDYMQLTELDFNDAVDAATFREGWQQFIRPNDLLVGHNHHITGLLENAGITLGPYEVLKSINHDPFGEFKTQKAFFEARSIPVAPVNHKGRAGVRLANSVTMVRYLKSLYE